MTAVKEDMKIRRPNKGLRKYVNNCTPETNLWFIVKKYNAYSKRVGQKELGCYKLLMLTRKVGWKWINK